MRAVPAFSQGSWAPGRNPPGPSGVCVLLSFHVTTPHRRTRRLPTGQARRHLAAALSLVYALAVWALPFAHAVILDGASGPAAHVESQGAHDHREAHDSFDCTVFSAARLLAAAPGPVPVPGGGTGITTLRLLTARGPSRDAPRGAYSSRAPPLA